MSPPSARPPHVVVVGAGAFGAWSAFFVRHLGAETTLLDMRGPGNAHASSGGETRILRAAYGADSLTTAWALRALDEWSAWQRRWRRRLLVRTGLLLMSSRRDGFVAESAMELQRQGAPVRSYSMDELAERYPQIALDDIAIGVLEEDAAVAFARVACEVVVEEFVRIGGRYKTLAVVPLHGAGGHLEAVESPVGERIGGDIFVFACGPWLPKLFPDLLGTRIRVTRQVVVFLALAPLDVRFSADHLPCWFDEPSPYYGLPALEGYGFKIASHAPGPPFDPDAEERQADAAAVEAAVRHAACRFPGLAGRPVRETRVCQYETTEDERFVIDQHPAFDNVWIAGGGSGHGFKHGPVVGRYVAEHVLGLAGASLEPAFRLNRTPAPTKLSWEMGGR